MQTQLATQPVRPWGKQLAKRLSQASGKCWPEPLQQRALVERLAQKEVLLACWLVQQ